MPDLFHEIQLRSEGFILIAGIDEAGRGPLAGPVTAGAVILPEDYRHSVLNDSKKLTEKQRETLYTELLADDRVHWSAACIEAD